MKKVVANKGAEGAKVRGKWFPRRVIYLFTAILLIVNIFLAVQVIYLNRRALFSKNINLQNNYFLSSVSGAKPHGSDEMEVRGEYVYRPKEMADKGLPFEPIELAVPYVDQKGEGYPNGCEAASATMLLQYWGYSVDLSQFIDSYLEKGEVKVSWGTRYGPNPAEAYVGDPSSENGGFGCFAPVIVNALAEAVDVSSHVAVNLTGSNLEMLANEYVANGIPVAIWATVGMKEISQFTQWQSYDKSETFLYPTVEHCLVLIGFDEENYYFNDPLQPGATISYPQKLVEERYVEMGKQAVAIVTKEVS